MERFFAYSLVLLLVISFPTTATIINIPGDYSTIQAGINASNDGDTVLVQPSIYYENIDFGGHNIVLGSLFLTSGDTSYISTTIIDGNYTGRVIMFNDAEDTTAVLCGFTIQHGLLQGNGAGVRCIGSNPTIRNNVISNNECYMYNYFDCLGGGIHCTDANPIIIYNTISDNWCHNSHGAHGGGIACIESNPFIGHNIIINNDVTSSSDDGWGGGIFCKNSDPIILNNTITGNYVSGYSGLWAFGGGISCWASEPTIRNNTIMGNESLEYGGGIHCYDADPLIIVNEITNNTALKGGGISVYYHSDPRLFKNIIRSNTASGSAGRGAGIYCGEVSNPLISNNVIIQNNTFGNGGGISCIESGPDIFGNVVTANSAYNGGGINCGGLSTPVLINNIFWDNIASNGPEIYVDGGIPLVNYCDVEGGWTGTGNMNTDPMFRDPVNEDFHLMATYCGDPNNSPLIDAGFPNFLDSLLDCSWGLGTTRSDIGAFCGGEEIHFPGIINIPGDYPTIQLGIDNAFEGDTVLVHPGTYYENIEFDSAAITVASLFLTTGDTSYISTTIIDGNSAGRVVNFSSSEDSNSVLCGFTIQNGRAVKGAGVRCGWTCNPIICHNRIINNQTIPGVQAQGGGIYCWGSPIIRYNTIVNNSAAESGGGIGCEWGGIPKINNNIITGNTASDCGGGIYCMRASPEIKHNTIIGNSSIWDGGGIKTDFRANAVIFENIISNNSTSGSGRGGGIACYDECIVTISNNTISGNTSPRGGAIFLLEDIDITISGNVITENEATGSGTNNGGGIVFGDNVRGYILDNTFINNTAENNGGGIHCAVGSEVIISRNSIIENTSVNGGGISCNATHPEILNNVIINNIAEELGGGIYLANGANPTITFNSFYHNSADSGGGIYCGNNSSPNIMNTILWADSAFNGSEIHVESGTPVITFCNVQGGWEGFGNINNDPLFRNPDSTDFHLMAVDCGDPFDSPCIDVGNPNLVDSLLDCSWGLGNLRSDMGAYSGGDSTSGQVIHVPDDYPTIQEAINATFNGDTVLVHPGTYVENINFQGHLIVLGSLYLTTNDTSYINSTIIDGDSSGTVVTFNHYEDSTTVITGFTLQNGYRGIYCDESNPNIVSNIICQNYTTGSGAGVYCRDCSPIINNNAVFDNHAEDRGGGLYIVNSSSQIIDNIISYNTCAGGGYGERGGGIYLYGGSVFVSNNIIIGNTAVGNGGGIFCWSNCLATITDNTIDGNSGENGGGIYGLWYSSTIIQNNIISGNSAENHGGGISCWSQSNSTITYNTINGNTASGSGGGIYCNDSQPTIQDNNIYGNEANYGGGVAFDRCIELELAHNSLTENTATYYGGGIFSDQSRITINRNILVGNSVSSTETSFGGGMFFTYYSNSLVSNCLLYRNYVNNSGGGIYCEDHSEPMILNTILWEDSAGVDFEIAADSTSNPVVTYCDIAGGWVGEGNIDVDPNFRDPENNDFHLMAIDCGDSVDSPCIDAGKPDVLDDSLDCDWGLGTVRSDMGAYGGNDSMQVGVEIETPKVPTDFSLSQNYPNPFNAVTVLTYSIPRSGDTSVTIWNILGQKVVTLYEGAQVAGIHKLTWDASEVASGIYFAHLQAGLHSKTIKMVLLK